MDRPLPGAFCGVRGSCRLRFEGLGPEGEDVPVSVKYLMIAAVCALGAAGLAQAAAPAAPAAPAAGSLTPEQVIAARQAAFRLSAAAFGSMKGPIDSGADVQNQVFAANALVNWARTLPTLFPAGTAMGQAGQKNNAKPEIWTNRADFEAKAAAYAETATQLAEAAKANDKAAFAAQWNALRETCAACHDPYRNK
jgi:cytochrome c556